MAKNYIHDTYHYHFFFDSSEIRQNTSRGVREPIKFYWQSSTKNHKNTLRDDYAVAINENRKTFHADIFTYQHTMENHFAQLMADSSSGKIIQ